MLQKCPFAHRHVHTKALQCAQTARFPLVKHGLQRPDSSQMLPSMTVTQMHLNDNSLQVCQLNLTLPAIILRMGSTIDRSSTVPVATAGSNGVYKK